MCPETKTRVIKYARLARLMPRDCTPDEIDNYISFFDEKNFSDVMDMIRSLESVDTEGMSEKFAFFDGEKLRNTIGDTVTNGNIREIILSNAARTEEGYFTVPKVIGVND